MSIQSGVRQILIHGMALVLVGLVWGLVVPHTPHPRLALGAHIQFVTNGMLLIVLAVLLLKLPHRVGPKSVWVMILAAWLTWPMALSEAANAWWGTTQMLPIAASQARVTRQAYAHRRWSRIDRSMGATYRRLCKNSYSHKI